MKIGFKSPAVVSWSVLAGATEDTDIVLSNGSPGDVTRFEYMGGSPDSVRLRVDWAAGQPVGAVGLAGLAVLAASGSPAAYTWATAPAGVAVAVRGRLYGDPNYDYDLGGNAASATASRLPDGTTCCWIVTDNNTQEIVGLEVEISNTSGWLTAGDLLEIGECHFWQTVDVGGQPGWSQEVVDPTVRSRSLAAQVKRKSRQTYRKVSIGLVPAEEADVRGAGLLNNEDYQTVTAALSHSSFCCLIPHYKTEAGVFSQSILNREALMGVADPGAISHVQRRIYGQTYSFEEVPAIGELP